MGATGVHSEGTSTRSPVAASTAFCVGDEPSGEHAAPCQARQRVDGLATSSTDTSFCFVSAGLPDMLARTSREGRAQLSGCVVSTARLPFCGVCNVRNPSITYRNRDAVP